MAGFSILIFGLLSAILTVNIWQLFVLRNQSRNLNSATPLNDAKYFELKYQLQFVTAIFPIVIAVLGFVGYSYISSLPEKINQEIASSVKPQIDSLKLANKKLLEEQNAIASKYAFLDGLYESLKGKGGGLSKQLDSSSSRVLSLNEQLNGIQRDLNNISNKDIIKQPIYIVSPLYYDFQSDGMTYKFSNMHTISGKSLPDFKRTPTIVQFSMTGTQLAIFKATNKGFKATHLMSTPDFNANPQKEEFGIIIFGE